MRKAMGVLTFEKVVRSLVGIAGDDTLSIVIVVCLLVIVVVVVVIAVMVAVVVVKVVVVKGIEGGRDLAKSRNVVMLQPCCKMSSISFFSILIVTMP